MRAYPEHPLSPDPKLCPAGEAAWRIPELSEGAPFVWGDLELASAGWSGPGINEPIGQSRVSSALCR